VALCLAEYVISAALWDARRVVELSQSELVVMVMVLGNGILLSGILHFKKQTYKDLIHPSRRSMTATAALLIPPVLLLVPGLLLLMCTAMDELVRWFPMSASEEAMFARMAELDLPMVLAICVLAPVVEEMLFRGVVLRSFLLQYSRRNAIVGSALLFGFAHMNLYQFCAAVVLGLLSGWLYERARSLIPCIALHAAYNSALVLWGWQERATPASSWTATVSWQVWLVAGLAGVCGASWLTALLTHRRSAGVRVDSA